MGTASHGAATSTLHLLAWRTNVDDRRDPWQSPPTCTHERGEARRARTNPSSPSSSTVSSATVPEEFGANEWLVEEMYDRFQADPRASTRPGWTTSRRTATARPAPTHDQRRAEHHTDPQHPAPSTQVPRRTASRARAAARGQEPKAAGAQARRAATAADAARRPDADPRARWPSPGRRPRPPSRPRAPPTRSPRSSRRPRRPTPATSRPTPCCAARPARTVAEHGRLADRPDRDLGPLGPGQAAVGQPHRHQQPPRPRPRRQGVVHPPDRLRAGQGAQGRCRR